MTKKPKQIAPASSPGPERISPGAYLRDKYLGAMFAPLPGMSVGVGVLLGVIIFLWLGAWAAMACGITLLLCSILLWVFPRIDSFEKGYVAERQVGRELERALTAKNCAVAHNVTGVMDSGDIDHVVATPTGVWVIETKYHRIRPKKVFFKALKRLHACRKGVEALLPPDTPVRPCLVLAFERGPVKSEWDGIRVYNSDTFRSEFLPVLRDEIQKPADVDAQVSRTIWQLSRG